MGPLSRTLNLRADCDGGEKLVVQFVNVLVEQRLMQKSMRIVKQDFVSQHENKGIHGYAKKRWEILFEP